MKARKRHPSKGKQSAHHRYKEPGQPTPSLLLLNHYLYLAFPNHEIPIEPTAQTEPPPAPTSPEERRAAEAQILGLYRDQRSQVSSGTLTAIDPRLLHFVHDALRRCAVQPDPLGAIEDFLKDRRPPRGRPSTPYRDSVIAGDIEKRVKAGMTIDKACEQLELEGNTGLQAEHLRRIYFDQKKAPDAALLAMDC
jgi:hypothetical protein